MRSWICQLAILAGLSNCVIADESAIDSGPATLKPVSVELRFVTVQRDAWERLPLNATVLVPPRIENQPFTTRPVSELSGTDGREIQLVSASTVVEVRDPVSVGVLSDQDMRRLMQVIQSEPACDLSLAPKVQVFSGRSEEFRQTTRRTLVTGRTENGPELTELEDGTIVTVQPEVRENDSLDLQIQIELLKVSDVSTAAGSDDQQIQIPEVTTTRVQLVSRLKSGETLAIHGGRLTESRQTEIRKQTLLRRTTAIAIQQVPLLLLVTPRLQAVP